MSGYRNLIFCLALIISFSLPSFSQSSAGTKPPEEAPCSKECPEGEVCYKASNGTDVCIPEQCKDKECPAHQKPSFDEESEECVCVDYGDDDCDPQCTEGLDCVLTSEGPGCGGTDYDECDPPCENGKVCMNGVGNQAPYCSCPTSQMWSGTCDGATHCLAKCPTGYARQNGSCICTKVKIISIPGGIQTIPT